jgi:predicted CoA-substrate-specific enzyme activase
MQKAYGVCLGASTISIAERAGSEITFSRITHDGRVMGVLNEFFSTALPATIGFTGRKFRKLITIPTVTEPEAVELAFRHIQASHPGVDCIVSAGGETFLVYMLDSKGNIRGVHSGNKCASGTGEFFFQQIKRMELGIEEAVDRAAGSESYPVAGRCSVFCKSDCTHALNKGKDKGEVAAGLCRMMAGKIVELLQKAQAKNVVMVGGVSSNRVVVDYIRESFPDIVVPAEALGFEALGALLWAEAHGSVISDRDALVSSAYHSFPTFPALKETGAGVTFKSAPRGEFYGGEYICGLDVGSTTTKAVLMRTDNHAITASVYLRTNGDPIFASRECYREILAQAPAGADLKIIGLGVTGSGRQIAGLHSLSDGVINEIVAHATAAIHFDPEVETIFEIGGQDAKYTYITNRVASDYAMNEACSAGTGSFLEEACSESLGIETKEIAGIAFESIAPPNFNDQCAAFIGSDIKTAVQEGVRREDIVAGLVYSICQNYLNRVKGNRPVGKKIFMQGGVCYNSAVPAAMAQLCGQEIIVPPEPGLMGAFGAALEVYRKIEKGLLQRHSFDLAELAAREVEYKEPFICAGGAEKCDRKCSVARITVKGKTYPFGGACNKYYNIIGNKSAYDTNTLDLVRLHEELVFRTYAPAAVNKGGVKVGIPASLFANTFYPLYAHFFTNIGAEVILGDTLDQRGMEATGAAFCYPVVLSHGLVGGLLQKELDYVFIPHVLSSAIESGDETSCTCPFVQAEPYYLKAAFHDQLAARLITAVLPFDDHKKLRKTFAGIGKRLGISARKSGRAFDDAWSALLAMRTEMRRIGARFIADLKDDETALVLFGRSYNAFNRHGNMGIPHKFATRGTKIIPHDFLPIHDGSGDTIEWMYWTTGQGILNGASYILDKPNLYGVYITNFSCGPDSFITGYFRNTMGQKPSLTLELDAHTADAGVDTRIEAFLDVVRGYRELNITPPVEEPFVPAELFSKKSGMFVRTGDGREYPLTDPKVTVLIPSMGDTAAKGLAAAFRHAGIRSEALPPPGQQELMLGKGEATCKECLPLLLTSGSLLRYLEERKRLDEVVVYFMPGAEGPCRFGQYNIFMSNHIKKNRLDNIALLSLSCENGYGGMSTAFTRRAWRAFTISDGLDEVYAGVMTVASDREKALAVYEKGKARVIESIATDDFSVTLKIFEEEMNALGHCGKKYPIGDAVMVNLTGEIYVRRDGFSRQYLVEQLADRGVLARTAPLTEWMYYTDYTVLKGIAHDSSFGARLGIRLKSFFMRKDESEIRKRLLLSGFYHPCDVDVTDLMDRGAALINPALSGETILTVSSALTEVGDDTHGVISIGPFGCMPCRIAESVLNHRLIDEKENFSRHSGAFWAEQKNELPLPFLAIETDGNSFPQVVEARLESLVLSAQRLKLELDKCAHMNH